MSIFKQGCQKMGPFINNDEKETGSVIYFFLEKGGLSYTWGLFGTHIRTMPYTRDMTSSTELL